MSAARSKPSKTKKKLTALEKTLSIPKSGYVIAIDGPAGTGKSSATRMLAEHLGFTHVDTGAIYRSVALYVLDHGGIPDDRKKAEARGSKAAQSLRLEFKRVPRKNPANRVLANGEDVTARIRAPEVSMSASKISSYPGVRQALLNLQRRLGCSGNTILEGRDIGTVIFADADVKFFLSATVEERAKRRLAELEAMGVDAPSYAEVKEQIASRDEADSTRATAPLKKAEDAIELDTSKLTLDEVVAAMEAIIRARLKLPSSRRKSSRRSSR